MDKQYDKILTMTTGLKWMKSVVKIDGTITIQKVILNQNHKIEILLMVYGVQRQHKKINPKLAENLLHLGILVEIIQQALHDHSYLTLR